MKMQRSIDEFEILNSKDSSLSSGVSQMSSIKGPEQEERDLRHLHLSIGKVVCVDYDGQDRPFFKYGTGCLIGANKVLIPANTLFSERTKKIHEHIYFFPDQYLQQGYDFRSDRKIRISNYYINPQYFNEMNDKNKTHSVYDVAICEMDKQDLQMLQFEHNFAEIGFQFNYNILSQKPEQLIICKYSEHSEEKRHILQIANSKITQKNKENKLINYHYRNEAQESMNVYEDAFIFYKVWRNNYWQFELIGIHKDSQRNQSYGFLLSQFFNCQNLMSYQLKNDKKIDFNQLMKISFNNLLEIMLTNNQTHDQTTNELTFKVNDLTQELEIKKNQQLRVQIESNQQKSKLRQEIEKLNKRLEDLSNGGKLMNLQAVKMKNNKINQLQSQNNTLKQIELKLRQNIRTLQSKIIDLQLFIEEQKVKSQKFNQQKSNEKQQQQNETFQLKRNIEKLNTLIELQKQNSMMKISQIQKEMENKIIQIEGLKDQIVTLCQRNQLLKRTIERLQRQQTENIITISELFDENKKLKQTKEIKIIRNQNTNNNVQRQNVTIMVRQQPENQQAQQNINRDSQMIPQNDGGLRNPFLVQNISIAQVKKIGTLTIHQFKSLPRSFVSSLNSCTTNYENGSILQRANNIPAQKQYSEIQFEEQQKCRIFNNIFTIFSRKSSYKTKLQKKLLQIKQLYEKQIKEKHKLKSPSKYLQEIYKGDKALIKNNYFENSKKRIQNAQKQYQVTLTTKGFSLYLENIRLDCQEFFKYDWINLEFLKITGCQIESENWQRFCSNAQIFLPNLKALRIELSSAVEIKESQLLNFWSIERIWFQQQRNGNQISNQKEVKNFVRNKLNNYSTKVKVEFH